MPHTRDAAELHQRLRLIALETHALDGYADACEDNGYAFDAEQVRAAVRKIRALIPDSADPAALTFEWAIRFTAPSGRATVYPMRNEADARDALEGCPERWQLARRPVLDDWEAVDA